MNDTTEAVLSFSKKSMRSRFWKLTTLKDQILAESAPLKKEREELQTRMAPIEQRVREINAEIKEIERPRLPAVEQERAVIVRALSGNVGIGLSSSDEE